MGDLDIRIDGRAGRITLTRPQALNALSHGMAVAIKAALEDWRDTDRVAVVILDAAGPRAFCAGGDLREIYAQGRAGDFATARRFWAAEYRMNALIAGYPKPVAAFMQGYVMGGGVGLGGHAAHRVVGETSRVAMPECAIGLIPDVGASHLLACAPGYAGEYLGLTGHRMGPGEAIWAGFADHFIPEARWPGLIAAIAETGDPGILAAEAIAAPEAPLVRDRARIDEAFHAPDLASLQDRLADTAWGRTILTDLATKSGLSLGATIRLVQAARARPGVREALIREYRFSWRAQSDGELLEGIRAAVIDKDRKPVWKIGLEEATPERIDAMLAPLGSDELSFEE